MSTPVRQRSQSACCTQPVTSARSAASTTARRRPMRLRLPSLVSVNKIDRTGGDFDRVLADISDRLALLTVPMTRVTGQGTRAAVVTPYSDEEAIIRSRLLDVLAERDDTLVAAYLRD